MDILNSQLYSLKKAVEDKNISPLDIAAVGITNQRETVIVCKTAVKRTKSEI